MSTVTVERKVAAPASDVWAVLCRFGDISWIPVAGKVEVEGEGPGMRRHIHGSGDGDPVVERLVACDEGARTLDYAIDANNPLPVTDYRGNARVDESGDGSTIVWSATFEPVGDEAEATGVVEIMLATLAGWLADAATGG
jgi:hypothetical protein